IVVLGDFNPAIFQPLWFWVNGLLPREEAEEAEIGVVSKEVASFVISGINIQVTGYRLGLTVTEPQQEPILRDLAIGTLSLLEHTPLNAIGFNRDMVFGVGSSESKDRIGFTLVPRENWETILEPEGMMQLIYQGKRHGCCADWVQFRIRSSGEIPFG